MKNNKILSFCVSLASALTLCTSNMGINVSAEEALETLNNDANAVETACSAEIHGELTKNKDFNVSLDNGRGNELPATMANLEMQTYYGTITEEEGFKYVIFALEPGELVNATLICPLTPDVDYDLLMYEFDMDGVVTLSVHTAVSTGSTYCYLNGAVNFVHYYDLSQVTVYCGNASYTKKLYHFANSSYVSS